MKVEITNDYSQFLEWTKSLIKDNANFESSIYDEWENAKQRQDQSPQMFHTYLASLEAQLPKMDEKASAQMLKAKLLPSLRGSMMQSGQLSSITTRIAMVNLAQQSWEGMILRGEVRKSTRAVNDRWFGSNDNSHSNTQHNNSNPLRVNNNRERGGNRGKGGQNHLSNFSTGQDNNQGNAFKIPIHTRGNGGSRGRGRGRGGRGVQNNNTRDSNLATNDSNKGSKGKQDNNQITCYGCGQIGHYKAGCPNELRKRIQVVKRSSTQFDNEDNEVDLFDSDETENF
jgi:hypothetical protein